MPFVGLELGADDGSLAAERLRATYSDLRLAFFTGGASPEVLGRARQLGRVFAKPDELDALLAWARAAVP